MISSNAKSLFDFRSDLIKEMIGYGHEVVTVAPENNLCEEFKKIGTKFIQHQFDRASTNPFNDLKFFINVFTIIKREKPDMVFSSALKPVIYASLAAKLCKVKNIYSLLPGLGYIFNQYDKPSIKHIVIQKAAIFLLKLGCSCNDRIIVQNPDDQSELVEKGIVTGNKCIRVNSSGVNFERFFPVELPPKPIFIMISRLLKDKGLLEYIKASSVLKQKYKEAEFLLLGPFDSNPSSVTETELNSLISDGCVKYLGETNDVRPFISGATIFVLPSYYREGVPRSIQEAMAMGRAIITTDWIGCRETVINGYNGYLTTAKKIDDLVEKMEYFILNPAEIQRMGENSTKYCKEKFDINIVNRQMLAAMNIVNSKANVII